MTNKMKNNNFEKWDYVVSGKTNGLLRIIIIGVLAGIFAALTIDQLRLVPNKMLIVAVFFGLICAVLTVKFIRLINRYFCFRICIGENGFFFQSNPFNGKYYRYEEIVSCKEKLKQARHSVGYGDPVTYRYFFCFTDKDGKTQKILFEKALFEKEFEALSERINRN